jgi:hypothetical protein
MALAGGLKENDMSVLICLANLIAWALAIAVVLWVLWYVFSQFSGGPEPTPSPAWYPPQRIINLLCLLVIFILLINFIICVKGGEGSMFLPRLL